MPRISSLCLVLLASSLFLSRAFKPILSSLECSPSTHTCSPVGRGRMGIPFRMTKTGLPCKVQLCATTRFVQYDEVVLAVNEFKHTYEEGKEDVSVLVGKAINLHNWMHGSPNSEMFPGVRFFADFDGEIIDESTSADIYIIKMQKSPHEALIKSIDGDLIAFARSAGNIVFVGGGELPLKLQLRRPDSTLAPRLSIQDENPPMPRFLVEVEIHNRSGPQADIWCRQYFTLIPQLRAVLLVLVYARRIEDPTEFGALAVLYRRGGYKEPYVEDAVSFGTAPLANEVTDGLPEDLTKKIREMDPVSLPIGPVTIPCPWKAENKPFILLKREDIFFWRFDPHGRRQLLPGLKAGTRHCKIDLWLALCSLNQFREI